MRSLYIINHDDMLTTEFEDWLANYCCALQCT